MSTLLLCAEVMFWDAELVAAHRGEAQHSGQAPAGQLEMVMTDSKFGSAKHTSTTRGYATTHVMNAEHTNTKVMDDGADTKVMDDGAKVMDDGAKGNGGDNKGNGGDNTKVMDDGAEGNGGDNKANGGDNELLLSRRVEMSEISRSTVKNDASKGKKYGQAHTALPKLGAAPGDVGTEKGMVQRPWGSDNRCGVVCQVISINTPDMHHMGHALHRVCTTQGMHAVSALSTRCGYTKHINDRGCRREMQLKPRRWAHA